MMQNVTETRSSWCTTIAPLCSLPVPPATPPLVEAATIGPAEQQSEERAIRTARGLAPKHAGVIAWNGEANPAIGEYGEPTTLFVHGDVPDME